jgi:hypothetical protein
MRSTFQVKNKTAVQLWKNRSLQVEQGTQAAMRFSSPHFSGINHKTERIQDH